MDSPDWWSLEKEVTVPSLVPSGHAPFQSATHRDGPTPAKCLCQLGSELGREEAIFIGLPRPPTTCMLWLPHNTVGRVLLLFPC